MVFSLSLDNSWHVMLSPSHVILSEAKNLSSAQDKLREAHRMICLANHDSVQVSLLPHARPFGRGRALPQGDIILDFEKTMARHVACLTCKTCRYYNLFGPIYGVLHEKIQSLGGHRTVVQLTCIV